MNRRYQAFIRDVTFGRWVIEAENADKAREIAKRLDLQRRFIVAYVHSGR